MTWIAKQQFQETELGVREVDPLTATGDLTSVGIDDELSEAEHTLTSGKFTAFHNGVAAAGSAARAASVDWLSTAMERVTDISVPPVSVAGTCATPV